MAGSYEGVLASIPGLGGYLAQSAENRQRDMSTLAQAGQVQGILSQVTAQQQQEAIRGILAEQAPLDVKLEKLTRAGPLGIQTAHSIMQVEQQKQAAAKTGQEMQMNQQFAGMGQMTNDQLDQLGQKLAIGGHPGAATVMNIADKRRAATQQTAALGAMRAVPAQAGIQPDPQEVQQGADQGTPVPAAGPAVPAQGGVTAHLQDSPYVGTHAKALQARIDAGAAGLTPPMIEKAVEGLQAMHNSREAAATASKDRATAAEAARSGKLTNTIILRDMYPKPAAGGVSPEEDLTPSGQKIKNDLIRNGLPVPKTRRGQVDNSALNSLGSESDAGARPISVNRADYKANQAALTANTKDLAAIRPYNDMLEKNANIAIDLAQKAILTDVKFANKSLNWLRQNAGDNPDVAELLAQTQIVSTEAARVLNNPRLVGQLTDSARHEMQGIINGDMPINSFTRVLRRMQSDGNNRVSSMVKERAGLMRSLEGGNQTETAPAPASTPNDIARAVQKTGKPYEPDKYQYQILPDGTVQRAPK